MTAVRRLLVAAFLLLSTAHAQAGGLGWYYGSFSWPAFQAYFGGGTPAKRLAYQQHLDNLVEEERKAPFYNIELGAKRLALWRSLINDGIHYERLERSEVRFVDTVIAIVFGAEAELRDLDFRPHTAPDYIHSGAFLHLLSNASASARVSLELFQHGRSYGQPRGRSACAGKGAAWACHGAYVILSPEECTRFGHELLAILNSPTFRDSEFEERKFVTPLANALLMAGRLQRGMYVHASD